MRDYRNGDRDDRGRRPDYRRDAPPRRPSPERKPAAAAANPLDDMRAARLAAMSATASAVHAERKQTLAERAAEERKVFEREEAARKRYHRDEAAGLMMKHTEKVSGGVGLAESLQRRGGKGLLRDI